MDIKNLIKENNIILNSKSITKKEILSEMCDYAYEQGIIRDKEEFLSVLINREKLGSTGIGKNIAIPHGRSECVPEISIILARHEKGIDFDSLDGKPARIFFMLAAPLDVESKYLKVLANLSMLLRKEKFREKILEAHDEIEILNILNEK